MCALRLVFFSSLISSCALQNIFKAAKHLSLTVDGEALMLAVGNTT